jgi:DNA-binding transcriptional MocR family regulator
MDDLDEGFEVKTGFRFMVVPKWILERDSKGNALGSSAVHVYTALVSYANKDLNCFPSHSTLADLVGKSVSSVRRALDELKGFGAIQWKGRGDGEQQSSNLYYLPHERGAEFEAPVEDYQQAETGDGFMIPEGVQKNHKDEAYVFALGELFGQPKTSKQWARYRNVAKEIAPHATTPKDVKVAYDKYPKFMPKGTTRTLEALGKHFQTLMQVETDKTVDTLNRLESLKSENIVEF